MTILVVVITGNHWWLDGIVAVAILAVCAWGVYGVRRTWHAALARFQVRGPIEPDTTLGPPPATVGVG
jgi:hypothetical protein